jgi:predicted aminopeptidase
MQYNYSKKMFTGRTKPNRIIGFSDNQLPDNWSSNVFENCGFPYLLLTVVIKLKVVALRVVTSCSFVAEC